MDTTGAQPGEDPKARVDRELGELLNEVRVALPGADLLLGFLLILPFSQRFGELGGAERGIYLTCLLATAAAIALLIAPAAQHRLGFRTIDKDALLKRTNRQVIAALLLVALAISLAVCLIVWVVFEEAWAFGVGGAVAIWFASWWFLIPPFWRNGRARPLAHEH